eukprot:2010847-Rhodomonas_salina.1
MAVRVHGAKRRSDHVITQPEHCRRLRGSARTWYGGGCQPTRLRGTECAYAATSALRFQKMEKEYWKSGEQVSTAHPQFVGSYEAI